jgi:hypothetical protein
MHVFGVIKGIKAWVWCVAGVWDNAILGLRKSGYDYNFICSFIVVLFFPHGTHCIYVC